VRGFRIVVASHGDLATALLASAELIVGPIDDARAVGLLPDQTPEAYADVLRTAVGPGPCLILADLFGGTPFNCARMVARGRAGVVVLAGVNLGIIIEAATSLSALEDEAIDALVSAGRGSIVAAGTRLVRSNS
jgi:mannose PTS system EIIA component